MLEMFTKKVRILFVLNATKIFKRYIYQHTWKGFTQLENRLYIIVKFAHFNQNILVMWRTMLKMFIKKRWLFDFWIEIITLSVVKLLTSFIWKDNLRSTFFVISFELIKVPFEPLHPMWSQPKNLISCMVKTSVATKIQRFMLCPNIGQISDLKTVLNSAPPQKCSWLKSSMTNRQRYS